MIRFLFLALCFLAFAYNLFLNSLRRRSEHNPIPDCLKDLYDAEKYETWKNYSHDKTRLELFSIAASFLLIAALLGCNAFGFIARLTDNAYLTSIYTMLLYLLLGTVLSTVFSYISTFRIEARYGFNKSTKKTFWLDTLKSALIELLLTTGLVLLLQLLYTAMGDYILLAFTGVMLLVVLCVTLLFPFFSKIFNKFTPMENQALEQQLRGMMEKNGIHIKSVSVMNASLRTTKSNAYFSGMGKTRSIVLYDNLVNNFTDDEITAVFAHEMGHALHKDLVRNYIFSFGSIVLMVLSVWALLKANVYGAFGFSGINYALTFILASECILPLLSPLTDLLSSAFTRKAEYRADRTAKDEGYAEALISALKKLGRENLVDLSPDRTLVALTYSHPTLAQRIEAIRKD